MSETTKIVNGWLCALLACVLSLSFCSVASAQVVRYVHIDGLGSVSVLTDENRNVIERREYEPYGANLGAPTDGVGYTGHVMDAATGLTYMQQRYYDPNIGRFLSVDPVGTSPISGLNFNRYWYASNNPYTKTDPDGRCDGPSTCAIDRDIAAMNRGEISRDEFMVRSESRAVGAVAGLALVATGGRAIGLTGGLARREISNEARRGIRTLEKRIAEHAKKIEDFKKNPTVKPGMEKMPEAAVKIQQQRRVRHLETEIRTFRENIEKLKNSPPPTPRSPPPPPPAST
ncbi:RHS repeat domain-containing protein [Xanthomonas arboricola]|uniref:RHS repeat domain-containing protein n=1 Tax=Xanthomonas arboricola TaxID=56448 RepID=UPI0018390FE1